MWHFWQHIAAKGQEQREGIACFFPREHVRTSRHASSRFAVGCGSLVLFLWHLECQCGESLGSYSDLLRNGAGCGRFWLSVPNVSTCCCNAGALLRIKRTVSWKRVMKKGCVLTEKCSTVKCLLQSLQQLLVFALKHYSVGRSMIVIHSGTLQLLIKLPTKLI